MLRILLFSPKGAGNHYYGPGINAYRMYSRLTRDDISLSLAHGYRDQEELDLFEEQVFISDVVNKNILQGVRFLRKAKKWVKENAHRFDVVHCLTSFHHSFMIALWFEQEGVPAFIKIGESQHIGFSNNSWKSNLLGLSGFRRRHANDITGYISISSEIRRKLQEAGISPRKICNIPNGVDTERFKPLGKSRKQDLRRELGLEDKFTVIFTGEFSDRKNPYLITRAFARVNDGNKMQLLLIGPDLDGGVHREKITKFIEEQNIENVRVMNFVEDIERYYLASDLFVLPSREEGLSNSMLEAQACGLPAAVTKISGSEDLIDESRNGTFTGFTPESIAEVMTTYFQDTKKWERHSAGAREHILENYDSGKILEKYLVLFFQTKRRL